MGQAESEPEPEKKEDFYYPFEAFNFSDTRATNIEKHVSYIDKSELRLGPSNDLFSVFPSVNIKDSVYLMGDYFSTDYSTLKSYTELEIKIDFYEVIKEALKRTVNWKTAVEQASGHFTREECPFFWERHKTFYEQMREQLYRHYTESQNDFDRKFYIDSTRFGKELDDYIDELSMGRYLSDLHPDAYDLYQSAEDFIVDQCFTIYWKNNGTRCARDQANCTTTEFDPVFRGHVEAVVLEQREILDAMGILDSVVVKVNQNGKKVKTPSYMG